MRTSLSQSYSLTFPQLDIFFHQQQLPHCSLYNICGYTRLLGALDVRRLQSAYQKLVLSTDIFRLQFFHHDEWPEQKLAAATSADLEWLDFSEHQEPKVAADYYLQSFFQTKFDLEKGNLCCCKVITISENEHWFVLVGHHLVIDGYGSSNFVRKLGEIYTALGIEGNVQTLPQLLKLPKFVDIVDRDREYEGSRAYVRAKQYWLDKFDSVPASLFKPYYRDKYSSYQGIPSKRQSILLSETRFLQLEDFTHRHQVGIQSIFLGVLYCYFSTFSQENDLVIGMPVHNRANAQQKQIIGMFASMSPIRLSFNGNGNFLTLVQAIAKVQKQDLRYQKFPVSHLKRLLKLSGGQQQLFDLCFNFLKLDVNAKYDDLETETRFVGHGFSQIPLSVNLLEFGTQQPMELQLDYNLAYWTTEEASLLLERLDYLLEQVLTMPETLLGDFSLVPEQEKIKIKSFHHVDNHFSTQNTVFELFEQWVAKHPNETCIYSDENEITFAALNQKSNQLAHYLRAQGVGNKSRVGICTQASIEMIVSVLAVLKTGAMYVPFDANFPQARLNYMVEDSKIQHLLTESQYVCLFHHFSLTLIVVDEDVHQQTLDSHSSDNLPRLTDFSMSDLAYLIYTSGSTGQPKGVMVDHSNLINYTQGVKSKHGINDNLSYGVLSTLATDLGNTSLYLALISGGCLHLLPEHVTRESHQFANYLCQHPIDILKVTPNHFDALYDESLFTKPFPCKFLFLGGEPLQGSALTKVSKLNQQAHCQIINHYGPTETTIGCLTYALLANEQYYKVPIGTPLPNTAVRILDGNKKHVPIGCVGELYVGGAGVTHGYLNQQALTSERFIIAPKTFDSDDVFYRTGDLVRCLANGEIEFIDRNDDQVKIRGYRVELGEISFQLTQLAQIEAAVVQFKADSFGIKHLTAFVILSKGYNKDVDLNVIRPLLAKNLPAHMLPEQLLVLTKFPLTANGKIDKKALPNVDTFQVESYVPADTDLEKLLVKHIAELLTIPENVLSITSNFFELGGDSILSIQLVSRIRQTGWSLTNKQIFDAPRIKDLALLLVPLADQVLVVDQAPVKGVLPLLPIQHLFFSDETDIHHYNQSVLLATPESFKAEYLPTLVEQLYLQHDALRLSFYFKEGAWLAKHQDFSAVMVENSYQVIHLSGSDFSGIEPYAQTIQSSLTFDAGGLFKAVYFTNEKQQGRLLLVSHHLIVDGVSWRVILENIEQLTQQLTQQLSPQLPAKTSSFQQWSTFLQDHRKSTSLIEEKNYWLAQTSELSKNEVRDHANVNFSTINFSIDRELTDRLLHHAGHAYRTQVNELLLAALLKTHCQWSGRKTLTLDLEGHGREAEQAELDLSQTVGWFTSLYPVKFSLESMDWRTLITTVKETYRQVPQHGLGYGVLKYLAKDADLLTQPLPYLVFNYLGQFDQVVNSGHGFSLTNENKGSSISAFRRPFHHITLNGIVSHGCLQFDLTFDEDLYSSSSISDFVTEYTADIHGIVSHCLKDNIGWRTLSDFPLTTVSKVQLEQWQSTFTIQDLYPATAMQQGLFFHSEQDKSAYITQKMLTLKGDLKLTCFHQAWQHLVDEHDIYRTVFVGLEQGMQQLVIPDAQLPWFEDDLSALSAQEQEHRIAKYRIQDKQDGFVMTAAPLMRISVWHLGQGIYKLLWSSHHALTDGWCNPLILAQVIENYKQLCQNKTISSTKSRPYRDYIAWLINQDVIAAQHFWQDELAGIAGPTTLPQLASDRNSSGCAEVDLLFTAKETKQLQLFSRTSQVTLSSVLQGAWAYLLSCYSRDMSVVFGTTVSGRPAEIAHVDKMIGLFINTIPVRLDIDHKLPLQTWLKEIHHSQTQRELFSYLPLTDIQKHSDFRAGIPLFYSLFVFENYPMDAMAGAKVNGNYVSLVSAQSFETSNYDLTLVAQLEQTLKLTLKYQVNKYSISMSEQLVRHFKSILMSMMKTPDVCVGQLSLLSEKETYELTDKLNAQQENFPVTQCLHEVFEQQVVRYSDKIAVNLADRSLSYAVLNQQANQLANYLREQGVTTETLVGIYVERTPAMIVALLAVLKAGGAYIPLDPSYPQDRINYIINDSKMHCVLTESACFHAIQEASLPTICLDDSELLSILTGYSPNNLTRVDTQSPENLAYVIYTSGSTGQPKGVLVEHRNVVRLFQSTSAQFHFDASDVWSMCHSYAFDFSVWEIWGALLHGGRLLLVTHEQSRAYDELYQILIDEKVTVLNQTPAAFNQLSFIDEQAHDRHTELSLRAVIFGGEALNLSNLQAWVERHGDAAPQLINMYGITETTVHVTYRRIFKADILENKGSLIGQGIADLSLYLLDEQLKPVPIGANGEIFVGGAGVSRGYLHRETLTTERFIQSPFKKNERLYRTGDLARYVLNSDEKMDVEYLGRIDDQVKVRGFRIELGEIEQQLLQLPQVKSALVITQTDEQGQNTLVAYVTGQQNEQTQLAIEQQAQIEMLRAQLKLSLPEYMIPSFFVLLAYFPLTANGKIDKRALPKPDKTQLLKTFIAPSSDVECQLASIWAELLLLDKKEISLTANFFELGGHSLLSLRLVAEIKECFSVELGIKEVFEHRQLNEQAHMITGLLSTLTPELLFSSPQNKIVDIDRTHGSLLMSYAQQRLWFIDQMDGGSVQYNMSGALKLSGNLNLPVLEKAFANIIIRHESLRTYFIDEGNEQPRQIIQNSKHFTLKLKDLSALTDETKDASLTELLTKETNQPFNLSADLMLRVQLVKLSKDEHVLQVTMHHIAADGWSMAILINEFNLLYRAYLEGDTELLPELSIQYADYAHWQRHWLQGEVLDKQLSYWEKQLADLPVVHNLPLDHARPVVQSFVGKTYQSFLGAPQVTLLNTLCHQQGATLFMGLHSAFSVLLARYSNEKDIVVGSPVANREQAEIASLIGFFVNTLVLRCDLSANPSFSALLSQSKQVLLDAYAHQQVPFEQIVEQLKPERSLAHSPLFQVMLVLQNNETAELTLPGLNVTEIEQQRDIAKYDLTLTMEQNEQGLALSWEYNCDLFDSKTIERMAKNFNCLLHGLISAPKESVFSVPLLDKKDTKQQIAEWNTIAVEPFENTYIHELFETHTKNSPQAIALVFDGHTMSYDELNCQSNQLARYLIEHRQVQPDSLVGICVGRSAEMVIAILAVLKAGGAYVPLDPKYPSARLAYMVNDANLTTVLIQSQLRAQISIADEHIVCLDDKILLTELANYSTENISPEQLGLKVHHLAYVIYTSGSSGQPKGVMIEHKSWQSYAMAILQDYQLTPADRVLQFSSLSFDILVEELTISLLTGGTLVLPTFTHVPSPVEFWQCVSLSNVTIATLPTAYWHQLCLDDGLSQEVKNSHLRLMVIGGEAISSAHLETWQHAGSSIRLLNTYGPTEGTVIATYADVTEFPVKNNMLPIGKASADGYLVVLDEHLNPVPQGVTGELHLSGMGLARGYLNREGLTNEKFISNPFFHLDNHHSCKRLYKTGDLVRWSPDENLIFLGRVDDQIKIRGFRIELGEIEHALMAVSGIDDALVTVKESATHEKRIVAYVVTEQVNELAQAESSTLHDDYIELIRQSLSQQLPEYMLPSVFVLLSSLPLTPNGKIDRHALPEPDLSLQKTAYLAPSNDTEKTLCNIWQNILDIERVGITDNFFELGGHSLLATQLITQVRHHFNVELNISTIFVQQSVQALAIEVEKAAESKLPPLVKVTSTSSWPLSFAQKRFWLADQMIGASSTYNMPAAIKLKGHVDEQALNKTYRALLARHSVFRTFFTHDENGEPVQKVSDIKEIDCQVDILAIHDSMLQTTIQANANHPFNLSKPPLFKMQLIALSDGQNILLANLHHIISDGWSINLLINEFNELYTAFNQNLEVELPTLAFEYTDYSVWQHQCFHRENNQHINEMLSYWSEHLIDAPRRLSLPADFIFDNMTDSQRKVCRLQLSRAELNALKALARKENGTLFSIVFAGLNVLLAKWTGELDVVIGTVVAGRHQTELESIIGCFINVLALRNQLSDKQSIRTIVQNVNKTVIGGLSNQALPFDLLIEHINPERTGGQNPLNNVSLRLQNIQEESLSLDGLAMEALNQDIGTAGAQLDIMFEAVESEEGLELVAQYEGQLFSENTMELLLDNYQHILSLMSSTQAHTFEQIELTPALCDQVQLAKQRSPEFAIASTFTIEPINDGLMFWGKTFNQTPKLKFAPYNQVFQQLLNPKSELLSSSANCHIVLFRWQDWLGTEQDDLTRNADNFFSALQAAFTHINQPLLLLTCPASESITDNSAFIDECKSLDLQLKALVDKQPLVKVLSLSDMLATYPVTQFFDAFMEEEAHIPYSSEAYSMLATLVYRHYISLTKPPHKVIVLDCDNTLWQGVCGEVGALGVTVSAPFKALQAFMLEQYDQGVVLCLNSKNNIEDVQQVFEQHPDMLLTLDHIVVSKVNWHAKSENIKEIAQELNLGLDSFIFVDDDTMQCAEVRHRLPQVLTLQLPSNIEAIPSFLANVWAFDNNSTAGTGAKRSRYYKEDQQRQQSQHSHFDLSGFIESLELKITIDPISAPHIARASELSLRTNQFNLTTRRFSEEQLSKWLANTGNLGWIVHVGDRFGDYGDVGVLLAEITPHALNISDFMLSCRAMGRGVEHAMVRFVGGVAIENSLSYVQFAYQASKKNLPALQFLQSLSVADLPNEYAGYQLSTEQAKATIFTVNNNEDDTNNASTATATAELNNKSNDVGFIVQRVDYGNIATSFTCIETIHRAVEQYASSSTHANSIFAEYVAPCSELEQQLCDIWQDLLNVERVGIKDNFFELGGHSLLATRMVVKINQKLNVSLRLDKIFKAQTIAALSDVIEAQQLILNIQTNNDADISSNEMELTI